MIIILMVFNEPLTDVPAVRLSLSAYVQLFYFRNHNVTSLETRVLALCCCL